LKSAKRSKRAQLVDELRRRVASFDSQITETAQQGNPVLQQVTEDLQDTSQKILRISADLESRNWNRVQKGHADARHLIGRAEWALSSVSAITLLISIWVSYALPRQVIKPLLNLKEAVDHAAEGNFEIDFDVQGKGEIVDLAESLRGLLAAVRQKSQPA
jgi:methyl-accepting chemotaxis protein